MPSLPITSSGNPGDPVYLDASGSLPGLFAAKLVGAPVLTGDTTWVDVVNGNDSTGIRGRADVPFKTIAAAITASSAGDTIRVLAGTYNETQTLTMKNGVSVIGFDPVNCIIAISVSGSAFSTQTAITMAENMVFANFTVNVTVSSGSITTNAILFAGTSNATSTCKSIVLTVAGQTTGTILAICDSGTGVATLDHSTLLNCLIQPSGGDSSDTSTIYVQCIYQDAGGGSGTSVYRSCILDASQSAGNGHGIHVVSTCTAYMLGCCGLPKRAASPDTQAYGLIIDNGAGGVGYADAACSWGTVAGAQTTSTVALSAASVLNRLGLVGAGVNNFTASGTFPPYNNPPSPTNDLTQGYLPGSLWVFGTSGKQNAYICTDARLSAAKWPAIALISGAIQSGMVANATVVSGSLASGQISRFALASGAINSGQLASGAVQGAAGGGARNVASGTLAHPDFGSGAIQSGDIASGQIGTNHFSSGTTITAARYVIDDFSAAGTPLLTAENISGFVAVSISQSGTLQVAMPSVSGRMPAAGIAVSGALSGLACSFWLDGFFQIPVNSGSYNFSGTLGQPVFVARSGQIGPSSGGFLSGGFGSGDVQQLVGIVVNSGGLRIRVNESPQKASPWGTPATFWIASGDISSGQIGTSHLANASVQSGTIASGQISEFGLASGAVNSGQVASGAVLGSLGGGAFTIASGTIGPNELGSGAVQSGVIASGSIGTFHLASGGIIRSGSIGSGAILGQRGGGAFVIASGTLGHNDFGSGGIQSGDIASGQIGAGHLASGSIVSGAIASGQIHQFALGSGCVQSGQINSGNVITYARNMFEDTMVANEAISGVVAVALDSGGIGVVRAQPGSGFRMPAIGISTTNVASGTNATFIRGGKLLVSASGAIPSGGTRGGTGFAVYVGSGGLLLNQSGFVTGSSSGGGPGVAGTSGRIVQRVGQWISGGLYVDIDTNLTSGLVSLPGGLVY